MKPSLGIFIIILVILGMFCFYNSLGNRTTAQALQSEEPLQGFSDALTEKTKGNNLYLNSLNDLEREIAPLEALKKTL